jgi:hypothetical protein
MAKIKVVKERLHIPIYDAFYVPDQNKVPGKKFEDFMTDSALIRFFVDVQNKTKLETNLQAAGVLPLSTAMRLLTLITNMPQNQERTRTATLPTSLSLQLRRHATRPNQLWKKLSTTP